VGVLHIVPLHPGAARDLLAPLAAKLAEVFRLETEWHAPSFDPELAFDASRGQYNSRILLAQLLQDKPPSGTRILGVAGVDLFIPVLTHVFGEAQLDGPAAVVSAYRLDNQIYGLPPDRDLLFERLVKEAIHELGHTYHLIHCRRHPCVMMSSTYVEDIDLKSDRFCPSCLKIVRQTRAAGTPIES
jgi:archaemetzincin